MIRQLNTTVKGRRVQNSTEPIVHTGIRQIIAVLEFVRIHGFRVNPLTQGDNVQYKFEQSSEFIRSRGVSHP
jgi:hypothetical protein